MGTLYYICKVEKKEYFDLGKRMTPQSMPFGKPFKLRDIYSEVGYLEIEMMDEINEGCWEPGDYTAYVKKIAALVWEWCGEEEVLFTSDNGLDAFFDGEIHLLKETGTRYVEA